MDGFVCRFGTVTNGTRHVVHVLLSARAEGTPRLVLQWLKKGDCRQSVLILSSQAPELLEQLAAYANVVRIEDVFRRGYEKYPKTVHAVFKFCRQLSASTVIIWPTVVAPWAGFGARLAGVGQVIVHFGNPADRGPKQDRYNRVVSWALWALRVDCVCCSRYVERSLTVIPGVAASIFRSVPNGIDLAEFEGQHTKRATTIVCNRASPAIMVATLEVHKDHMTLLEAVPTVLRDFPQFHLEIVGDGSLRGLIEARINELGIDDSVTLRGSQTSIADRLRHAGLFVFSTTAKEGLGIALIEALAAGCAVVATDVPACREVLKEGELGMLVIPSDPQALAAVIVRALRGGANIRPFPEVLMPHLARYDINAMVKSYLFRDH